MWTQHPGSNVVISDAWNQPVAGSFSYQVSRKLNKTAQALQRWNRTEFGQLQTRIREIQSKLQNIQENGNPFEVKNLVEEKKLKALLKAALKQQETLWRQKSRLQWLREGDCNTRFFHLSTLKHRARNRISQLKDDAGCWVTDEVEIEKILVDHFNKQFTSAGVRVDMELLGKIATQVSEEDNRLLIAPVTEKEVHDAIWQMHPNKSPGPDGFSGLFFHKYWAVIKNEVVAMVQKFFDEGEFSLAHNHAFLVLLPKVDIPAKPNDFRPISLCNFTYKVFTKIMVLRLQKILPRLIGETQCAFISQRSIQDNIVLCREFFHQIKHSKAKECSPMVIKVDLHKAYDSLEWNFVEAVLLKFGFCQQWVQRIMFCLTTGTQAILVNGAPSALHKPSRGIRQGDPLSPYIFTICAQVLSFVLDDLLQQGQISGLKISQNNVTLTHLFYADDMLILTKSKPKECAVIRKALQRFSDSSGLQINLQKSAWIHGKMLSRHRIREITAILGMAHSTEFKKYLGTPIAFKSKQKQGYVDLLTAVSKRLAGWKSQLLNQAGRSVLIKTVTSAMPSHIMQTTLMPKIVLEELDKINKAFFWSHDPSQRKLHTVAWEKICRSKDKGGLGIRAAEILNHALLGKLAWRLHSSENSLMVRCLKSKYFLDSNFLQAQERKGSRQWRDIKQVQTWFEKGLLWRIGNGKTIPLRDTRWIPWLEGVEIRWADSIPWNFTVSNLINQDTKTWKLNHLEKLQNEFVSNRILAIHLPREDKRDTLVWKEEASGKYSVRSATRFLQDDWEGIGDAHEVAPKMFWKKLWKLDMAPKVKLFIWKVRQNGLRTCERLQRIFPANTERCVMCDEEAVEDTGHLLLHCSFARAVWFASPVGHTPTVTQFPTVDHWLDFFFLQDVELDPEKDVHRVLVCYILWMVWKARNDRVFQRRRPNPLETVAAAVALTRERENSKGIELSNCGSSSNNRGGASVEQRDRNIQWSFPPVGWLKLNTDGAASGNPGLAGAGAVIRDEQGHFRGAISKGVGFTSALVAEAWAMVLGLHFASQWPPCKLVVESDSQVLINAIHGSDKDIPWSIWALVHDIRAFSSRFEEIRYQHTLREGNRVADALAKDGAQRAVGGILNSNVWCWVHNPPLFLRQHLWCDAVGMSFVRGS